MPRSWSIRVISSWMTSSAVSGESAASSSSEPTRSPTRGCRDPAPGHAWAYPAAPFKPAGAAVGLPRESPRRRLRRAGARAGLEARAEPVGRRGARRARESRDRAARQCHPIRAEDGDSLLELARTIGTDLVVIGPGGAARGRGRGPVCGTAASRSSARARRPPDRGLEELRQGRHARGRRARSPRRCPSRACPCVVKADWPRGRQGVSSCATPRTSSTPALRACRAWATSS
jgi:hypothetical protein